MRGLKPMLRPTVAAGLRVAPYMGAWIETGGLRQVGAGVGVAPYMGAWIETV